MNQWPEYGGRALRLILKEAGTADPWAFLLDLSTLLYTLDKTGSLDLNRLREDGWTRFVWICREIAGLDLPDPPLSHVGDGCAALVEDLLEDLASCPEVRHRNICGAFDALLREAAAQEYVDHFFTPASLAGFMAELLNPQPGETVVDPACGSGRLLTAALAWQADLHLIGVEIDADLAALSRFNLYFHGAEDSALARQDFLEQDPPLAQMCDVILSNPPYYTDISLTLRFIDRIFRALKPGGRCAILVPEGFLTNTGGLRDVVEARAWILREHTLEAVVSLPMKIYKPYMLSKSSLLLLRKGKEPGGRPVFFTCLPEYEGPESGFSDAVYRTDMARIGAAWRAYCGGIPLSQQEVGRILYWTADPEEIRSRAYLFSADTYRPAQYATPEAYQKYSLQRLAEAQGTLEELFRRYRGDRYDGGV